MKLIELTQGQVASIDDELFGQLSGFKWYASRSDTTFYAVHDLTVATWKAGHRYREMHRHIFALLGIEVPPGFTIDHADGNGLNNQRFNLRLATPQQQGRNQRRRVNNTSGLIGVTWDKKRRKWRALAKTDAGHRHLGYFDDAVSAAIVRDAFVRDHFGPFAVLNGLQDRRQRPR